MWNVLVGLLLAAQLGGAFGTATASAEPTSPGSMELEITVEAAADLSVVVHFVIPGGGEQQTVAMRERAPGLYGAVAEIPAVNAVAVFEIVGSAELSAPAQLTDLGVDPAVVGGLTSPPVTDAEGISRETRQWGWLALALGASSLALVAVWLLVGGPRGPARAEAEETVL